MTENRVTPAMAKAQAAYEDARAICAGFKAASDLMDPSFNPERNPFADLDFQAGWNTANAAKAAAIEAIEAAEDATVIELPQGLKNALAAYEVALVQEGDLSYAADAAYEQIKRATYEAQGEITDADYRKPSSDAFWLSRWPVREAADAARLAIEKRAMRHVVEGCVTERPMKPFQGCQRI